MRFFEDVRVRFLGSLGGLLVVFAQPALAQAPLLQQQPSLQSLEQRLAVLATENPGDYGIAALDLTSGATVSFNGNQAFPMASTVKVAIAAAYLSEVDAGRRRLDDMIGSTAASTLMEAMLIHSDNRATDMVLASLGGPATVDGWLRGHQLSGIRVDRTIAQLLADRRDLRDVRDSSTPTAMLGLLRLIDSGSALSPASRSVLLDMMRRCATGSNRIRGILPPGAGVEHKTGTLNGYTGDIGFLTLADGRRIAVVFFARGGSNRPAVIATAARAIYDGFSGDGPAGQNGLAGLYGGRVVQAGSYQSGAGLPAGLQQYGPSASTPSAGAGLVQGRPAASACILGGRLVQATC